MYMYAECFGLRQLTRLGKLYLAVTFCIYPVTHECHLLVNNTKLLFMYFFYFRCTGLTGTKAYSLFSS